MYDGVKELFDKIHLAEKREHNASRSKNRSQERAYRVEREQWIDALCIILMDEMACLWPTEPTPKVLIHHANKLIEKFPVDETTKKCAVTRELALEEIIKIIKESV